MPEAPEVLSYYNFIYNKLFNTTLISLKILSGKYLKNLPGYFHTLNWRLPSKITKLELHGKLIFIHLENDCVIEMSHGMTGFWTTTKEKHARIEFNLQDNKNNTDTTNTIYFEDPRNFARITIYISKKEYQNKIDKLGIVILDINEINYKISEETFIKKITKKKNSQLGIILLDQSILSGIGNYLRCDILWYLKYIQGLKHINHTTKIKDLSIEDLKTILNISVEMTKYYAHKEHKLSILPKNDTFVYMQEYDIFNNLVKREKFGARTIHYI
jgi:formamidopyrimidine-DNA glycosylase